MLLSKRKKNPPLNETVTSRHVMNFAFGSRARICRCNCSELTNCMRLELILIFKIKYFLSSLIQTPWFTLSWACAIVFFSNAISHRIEV